MLRPRTEARAFEDFVFNAPPELASGDALEDACVRVRRYGDASAPHIIVLGGISATRCVSGDDGWWNDIVAPGAAVDLDSYAALGIDFAPNTDQRVRITPHDQARLIETALDALGIERVRAIVGASYGGMVALAFAQHAPERVERLCVISAAHEPAPLASAWRGVQRRIAEFGIAAGDPDQGLSLARQLAMITYRSSDEFAQRFDRQLGPEHKSDLDRYLAARGDAFRRTMPAQRWLSLSEAIDRTQVSPEAVRTPVVLGACASDQLVPLAQMQDLARRLPHVRGFFTLQSLYGHDAFLKEREAISRVVRASLE